MRGQARRRGKELLRHREWDVRSGREERVDDGRER